ncbi:protein adenylyltransferase SelO [Tissierella sp. Yu-01]|uniref:protein adenylyltransferase SelO n=1 Tax=Tissierella sp. Yu-01 TaxID=3035694 RepID=UPI00240D005D|nr:YdiU family protein [Tissierella sp. Yu-01]WFA10178.1 YdiU family protein [Tissierella sp. Yu-01]
MTNNLQINKVWNFENSYSHLPQKLFTAQNPESVKNPKLVILNKPLAEDLGLDINYLESNLGLTVLAGNSIPEGAYPLAQAYAGHQYGYFTMLGDGRAILIGEHITPKGERYDIQLKGSGRTPYSRGGDGKAALGPMLREYIISEAMYKLGILTTRSLAVVTTGESIFREKMLPGAVLTRIASSHIRVGTFQYISHYGTIEDLRLLADYTILRHYPEFISEDEKYLLLLKGVVNRQAKLIAKWQLVGFIHGVMNTDNMLISGETIDYGPCAFMDTYNPNTVFSSIDRYGRYSYKNQPEIAAWNLARFAESILPLLHDDQEKALKIANEAISDFEKIYYKHWLKGMRKKLGLFGEEPEDEILVVELLNIMEKYKADFTNTFKQLTLEKYTNTEMFSSLEFENWSAKWQSRLENQDKSIDESKNLMKKNNPAVIPINHRVEEALSAAVEGNDYCKLDRLLDILSNPYEYSSEQDEYSQLPPPSKIPYRTFCGT